MQILFSKTNHGRGLNQCCPSKDKYCFTENAGGEKEEQEQFCYLIPSFYIQEEFVAKMRDRVCAVGDK